MLFKNYKELIENGKDKKIREIRKDILDILSYSLKSVDPYKSVKKMFSKSNIFVENKKIDLSNFKEVYLVSFGKASVGMAQAVCDSIKVKKGFTVTNEKQNKVENKKILTFVGSHPIPNGNSVNAASEIINLVKNCNKKR